MPSDIQPRPGILDIAPYVGGASTLAGGGKVYKLSSNENPLGPSPKAVAAYRAAAETLARYPSSDHADLRAAIGKVHGVDPARVICGDGSDEVISWLCYGYAGPGDEVLYTEHGFSMYKICALAAGATPVAAPEIERRVDVGNLLSACNDRTRLVFIANPANPTGTLLRHDELTAIAKGLPPRAMLVIDGAYAEFAEDYDAGLALVEARENVVMTRTFSKIYGLGGLRVGWGYGPAEIIGVLNRLRGPFNVSSAGLATAKAAVLDVAYTAHCKAENAKWRGWLRDELAEIGIASDEAHGNFVLARFGSVEQAQGADAHLRKAGIIVRQVKGYGLPECLRITVGDEQSCPLLIGALTEFMKGRG
ncbi:MAG: histidinol-phosphate transaminase [Alphaproteobacteria bacterium]|nr:histidinol-phosphate transaminase [Alphaproteobacteria bacterium]